MKKYLLCFFIFLTLGNATQIDLEALDKDFKYIQENIGGDALLMEASTYEIGMSQEGISQDILRATKIYQKLYRDSNPIAAYKLGIIAWALEKNPKEYGEEVIALLKETDGLSPEVYFKKGAQANTNMRYQTITPLLRELLGIYLFSKDRYKESIEVLSDSSVLEMSPAQLYLAFSYLQIKQNELANFFLNKACNNSKKDTQVTNFCMNSNSLNRTKMGE